MSSTFVQRSNTMLTNLRGRLRNTTLPIACGLMPLFEAVVNSIHAIEEDEQTSAMGQIQVEILRKPQQEEFGLDGVKRRPGPDALGDIVGFKITDTGVGFNDENMKSFMELDTDHKAAIGGRGIGRLLWLKAFKKVTVTSVFFDRAGKKWHRRFTFDHAAGVAN